MLVGKGDNQRFAVPIAPSAGGEKQGEGTPEICCTSLARPRPRAYTFSVACLRGIAEASSSQPVDTAFIQCSSLRCRGINGFYFTRADRMRVSTSMDLAVQFSM